MSVKLGVLKNFLKFTGEHLYRSLFLIKLQAFQPSTLLKKRFQHRCFHVNFTNGAGKLILNFIKKMTVKKTNYGSSWKQKGSFLKNQKKKASENLKSKKIKIMYLQP